MTKHLLTLILAAVCTLAGALPAFSQGKTYIGCCEGHIASATEGNITGLTGELTISLGVCLTKEMLASNVGCQITGIHFGLPKADGYPKGVTAWMRASQSGANILEGTIATPKEGWNDATTKSYTITGQEEELWIGVTFTQPTKMNIISFAGPTVPGGCWIAKGDRWTDYSGRNWGSLALEAIVEGNVPTHNLVLQSATVKDDVVKIGDAIQVTGTIKNQASTPAVKPVLRYKLDGKEVGTYTFPETLAYSESADYTINVPTNAYTDNQTVRVDLELGWADGTPDDYTADNTLSVTAEVVKELFYRTMVVEEGTGGWCQWCVVGIVGLSEMKKKYGDRFIGIAGHDDQYATGYNSWLLAHFEGLPNCLVNRQPGDQYPSFENLNNQFLRMPTYCNAKIEVSAEYDAKTKKITAISTTQFLKSENSQDYRIVFFVLENQLPLSQKNAYSGNARGPMGGFEDMPSPVMIGVDDVVRSVFPSSTGTQGALPANLVKNHLYTYKQTADMPSIRKAEEVELVALLIDGKTGQVVQGAKTTQIYGLNAEAPEGVHSIFVDENEGSQVQESRYYDLQGRALSASAKGMIIHNGKKIIKK